MTFLTSEVKEQLNKLDVKELDKIVQYIDKIKHSRKFSILQSHGNPLINQHHFSSKKKAESGKPKKSKLPSPQLDLLRKLSMPDNLSEEPEKAPEHVHVFSTKAEVEWYYIVDGEDIVYPEEFCDVLESLFRKPGHTGRHQKQTPFVDGNDTCVVDLHLMRHTNQRTGKIYPLRRKKNPLFKPKSQEKKNVEEVPASDAEGGATLPEDNNTPSFFGSAFSAAFSTAQAVHQHPNTKKAADTAQQGAKTAAKHVGRMFTRTLTWLGSQKNVEEEPAKVDKLEGLSERKEELTEEEEDVESEDSFQEHPFLTEQEIVEDLDFKTPEPRQRGIAMKQETPPPVEKRDPSPRGEPKREPSTVELNGGPDMRKEPVENLD